MAKDTVFQDNSLHVSTYITALDREYGSDYLFFEPETLQSDLNPTADVLDKIQAGITLKTTSMFWNDIVSFENIALALNNRSVSFGEYQELSPAEMAWAMVEARLIAGAEAPGYDVKVYIAKRLFDEGYVVVPQDIEYDRMAPVPRVPQGVQACLDTLTLPPRVVDLDIQQSKMEAIDVYVEQNLVAIIGEAELL